MPKISVVVPCCNVAKWVERCLDSLINQTFQDLEIICIDDKSIDGTLGVLKKYAKKDSRIKIIEQKENGGVARARNSGLNVARGEYIGFVDPDDYVEQDFYEKLYNKILETKADVVKGTAIVHEVSTGAKYIRYGYVKDEIIVFFSAFWSALYDASFLKRFNIRFSEQIVFGEDTLFLANVSLHTQNIEFVPDAFYNYFYLREGSLDSVTLSDSKADSICKACNIMEQMISQSGLLEKHKNLLFSIYILSNISYNISKSLETEVYRQKMFDMLVDLEKKYGLKKELIKQFGLTRYRFIKKLYYRGFISYHKRRFYLFAFIPFILEETFDEKKMFKLFEVIPIIKIKG